MKRITLYSFNIVLALVGIILITSCQKKSPGYLLASEIVIRVIQLNVNNQLYTIKSVPDVISFTTSPVTAALPNYRQYLVKGNSADGSLGFSLSFHIDTLGSGHYILEGSQLSAGSKSYISLASKTTDRVRVTQIDDINKLYTGNFTFYAFNQSSATDSVLVTGSYSVQY